MRPAGLRLARFMRVGAPVHAVAIAEDGRHVLAGSERDLRLLDRPGNVRYCLGEQGMSHKAGERPFSAVERPFNAGERPFNALAMAPDFSVGLAGERTGRLHRLSFSRGPESGSAIEIWREANDLYSLGLAPGINGPAPGSRRAGMAVIGHLGPALSALDLAGRPLWRHHPADGTATEGRSWTVALKDEVVYAGCSGGRRYSLLAIAAATGLVHASRACPWPVTLVAARDDPPGVIAVLTRGGLCEVHAFAADLSGPEWSYRPEPGEVVTALAACGPLAALGTNSGFVSLLGAPKGELLVRQDLLFASTVLSLALAGPSCRPGIQSPPRAVATPGEIGTAWEAWPDAVLAAGLANGQVAYLVHAAGQRVPGRPMGTGSPARAYAQ